jgi:ABC-type nitrate/sulfonate/bicarbonate transport system substrate-binding protein
MSREKQRGPREGAAGARLAAYARDRVPSLARLSAPFWLVLVLAACQASPSRAPATPTPAATREKLVVGYVALNATQLPSWVAKDRGIFDKNGLDVELQYVQSGSSPVAALLAGQLHVLVAGEQALQATLQGGDLLYIAAPTSTIFFALYTTPDITDAASLKGKRIGITQIGSATHTAAKMALRSLGLAADKDVTLLNIGSAPNILAALQNGAIDGGMLSSPTSIQARNLGLRELVNVAKLDDPFPSGWAAASRSYLANHRDAIRRYVQSIAEAVAFEIRNPEETQSILAKYVSIENPAVAKEAYDEVVPYLKKNPIPETKAIKGALDELSGANPNATTADPATFVDQSFAQELQASGFIDGLYR